MHCTVYQGSNDYDPRETQFLGNCVLHKSLPKNALGGTYYQKQCQGYKPLVSTAFYRINALHLSVGEIEKQVGEVVAQPEHSPQHGRRANAYADVLPRKTYRPHYQILTHCQRQYCEHYGGKRHGVPEIDKTCDAREEHHKP